MGMTSPLGRSSSPTTMCRSTASLLDEPLDQLPLTHLLTVVEHAPCRGIGGESGGSNRTYRIWLECAFERATTAATRRLIEDVLDDISMIGPIDGELDDLVVSALASVEFALEWDERHP
jgi:hypothetical protein